MRNKLIDIIRELKRCALQNEKDAGLSDCYRADSTRAVIAVAAEQRRMLQILKQLLKET